MRHLTLKAAAILALTAAASAPLMAETVEECYGRVTRDCNAALEDSNWAEKVAVGIVCAAMYVACGGVNITVRAI